MVMNDAHNQWANRPSDERFWTLGEMATACAEHRSNAVAKSVDTTKLSVQPVGERGLVLAGEHRQSNFTNFSFGQLCGLTGIPADLMRQQPNDLAATNLNWAIKNRGMDDKMTVALLDKKQNTMRGLSSGTYCRIWNSDIINRISPLQADGWRLPPARPVDGTDPRARAATKEDCLINRFPGLGIKEGDMIAPAGAYASDRDMFAFMVNEQKTIKAGGVDLCRGFFVENSEVPGISFKLTTFLYSGVCGNHFVHGAAEINKFRVIHTGEKAERRAWIGMKNQLLAYANESANEIEGQIRNAQMKELGANKMEVVETLWNKKIAPRGTLEKAFDEAVRHPEDGHVSPRSVWGMVQGFTRLSQQSKFMDGRVGMDRVAGKLMALVN